jgi:hydroxyethylthiazole kinase-like uncharacterized protein yjeF
VPRAELVLDAAQMRSAEQALIERGTSVDDLMERAGRGAAEWIWRASGGRRVTVVCGPGNNGGDGYVIAQALHERGAEVCVIAAYEARTEAASAARARYQGAVLDRAARPAGDVLVDCLFGTGIARQLGEDDRSLLDDLFRTHPFRVAVDLPSGLDADTGEEPVRFMAPWNLTIALGAWKPVHILSPARARLGQLRLVPLGLEPRPDLPHLLLKPRIAAPARDAHKYTRGLLGVVQGAMPGAARLAARAAQHAGAGYVKLIGGGAGNLPDDLVADSRDPAEVLADPRFSALLIGPGLGQGERSPALLERAMAHDLPAVLDADALCGRLPVLLARQTRPVIATPHEGEFARLAAIFGSSVSGTKIERARDLARVCGMVIVAKGPDTVIAAPDGRTAIAPQNCSWLSTAGTGDVLAGTIASRLATGPDAFVAACEGVWLHGEAARLSPPAFTAGQLAAAIQPALASCL